MSIEVIWTPQREEEFIRIADLNDMDAAIIRMRHHRNGRVKDLQKLADKGFYICPETYDAHIRQLKDQYDLAQTASRILPKRMPNKRLAIEESKRILKEIQK